MKRFCQIALFIVILCALASCASKRGQVPCPAYGSKSSGYERMPY